jgi:hypothetical protein
MKTFRNLCSVLSLLAIAGLWTGCANDEAVETPAGNQAISFRVQGSLPTLRATGTTTDYVNAFVVNAYGDVTGATKATMLGTTVYRIEGSTSNVFDYNPKAFYYTEDASVGFSAYSPVSKLVTSGLKDTGSDNKITYTVPAPDATNGNTTQEDLLVAFTEQSDFKADVNLTFKHALSRVYVKAKNTMSENVIIESIKLVNLYNEGTLDIDDYQWANTANVVNINKAPESSPSNKSEYKILWDHTGQQDNTYIYALPASGVAVPASSAQSIYVVSMEQGMLILPQTVVKTSAGFDESADFYLEVKYKVANINETAKIVFDDINGIASPDEGLTFEFGRQYALNITFNNQGIQFTVDVENWETPPVEVPKP